MLYVFQTILGPHHTSPAELYRVIQKDGLNFIRLHFLNYTRYVNGLHNI